MAKRMLTDSVLNLTGLKVRAERTVNHVEFSHGTEGTLTYKPYGADGSKYDTNTLVYELMIIAAYDMLEVGKVFVSGELTASQLAGTNGNIHVFLENGNEDYVDYGHISIQTKTFCCRFQTRHIFEQIAEWEGVAGIQTSKAHKFACEASEPRIKEITKPYKRCHGYKPATVSVAAENARINKKFKVLGELYRSLTSEGMRKAMSVPAAARCFDNMKYEIRSLARKAMEWKLWKDYGREPGSQPIPFCTSDFKEGPEIWKQVDEKYAASLVGYFQQMLSDCPKPSWPKQGDVVMAKKYQGKFLCEGLVARLSAGGDSIEWYASLRVGKFNNECFLPEQLEPAPEKPKKAKPKAKVRKSAVKSCETPIELAERLRVVFNTNLNRTIL